MPERTPVTELIARWRGGDEAAAAELYRQYAVRLGVLAAGLLGRRLSRRVDPDDIVQSVFRTFFRRAGENQYPVDHSGALWQLLKKITENKVRRQGERHRAAKRDVGAEVDLGPDITQALENYPTDGQPDPADAAALAEAVELLVRGLKDPEPRIFELALEGYSTVEITAQLGCSRWTVRRTLNRLGEQLARRLGHEDINAKGGV